MIPQHILDKLPLVSAWIGDTLATHKSQEQAVSDLNFKRLPMCYSQDLLSAASVVVVDELPQIPLADMGMGDFSEFEAGSYSGVTYLNTYFLLKNVFDDESIHFHELVHVVQWRQLGMEDFAKIYAIGLLLNGYRQSPLEEIAYQLQGEFDSGNNAKDVEPRIIADAERLRAMFLNG